MSTSTLLTPRWKIACALAIVYVVWGSTFLAIRVGVATMPPFFLAAMRFTIAGLILYIPARWHHAQRVPLRHWASAAWIGLLLLVTGNGVVVWAEQRIPSGLAALIISTVPLWMVCLPAITSPKHRPSGRIVAGLIMGLGGVAILIPHSRLSGGDTTACLALVGASLS